MIVVEGPDGSGKDHLIADLKREIGSKYFIDGPRASRSKDGPVDNLGDWMLRDMSTWPNLETCRIYNRYPIISEPIYGDVLRGGMDEYFEQVAVGVANAFRASALVVVCLPPLEVVRGNVSAERDMPGVAEHIDDIYARYCLLKNDTENLNLIEYDYTNPGSLNRVVFAALVHLHKRGQL